MLGEGWRYSVPTGLSPPLPVGENVPMSPEASSRGLVLISAGSATVSSWWALGVRWLSGSVKLSVTRE